MASRKKNQSSRLTITLRQRQRKTLEAIAGKNHVSLAFAIRYALDLFAAQHKDDQLPLQFPRIPAAEGKNE